MCRACLISKNVALSSLAAAGNYLALPEFNAIRDRLVSAVASYLPIRATGWRADAVESSNKEPSKTPSCHVFDGSHNDSHHSTSVSTKRDKSLCSREIPELAIHEPRW